MPALSLSPKAAFCSDTARASSHSDTMASPSFQAACSAALLEYQYRACGGDPALAASVTFKLRGAQEFLGILMNLGLPESTRRPLTDDALTPPEDAIANAIHRLTHMQQKANP